MKFRTVGTAGLILVGILWFAQSSSIDAGQPSRVAPPGGRPWKGPRNSVLIFTQDRFEGMPYSIENVTDRPSGEFFPLHPGRREVSSLRWNLPPGVIVLFSESKDGRGNLFPIWGSYENPRIKPWIADNKISAWAWYHTW